MKAFWIWTFICVALVALGCWLIPQPSYYDGANIEVNTCDKRQMTVKGEGIAFSAASPNFFVLRKKSGESIVSVPTQKPLGWEYDEYYVFETATIESGTWLVENGENISVKLSSEGGVKLMIALKNNAKLSLFFFLIIAGFVVWILGIFLAER